MTSDAFPAERTLSASAYAPQVAWNARGLVRLRQRGTQSCVILTPAELDALLALAAEVLASRLTLEPA